MSAKLSLKQIMEEQAAEELKSKAEKAIQKQKEEEEKKLLYQRMLCAKVDKFKIHEAPIEISWLDEYEFIYLDRIIYSLMLPENRTKTIRYADTHRFNKDEKKEYTKKGIFELVTMPYLHIELDSRYTSYNLLCWVEDGLYKIFEFASTRCPSGGCDGEHIHQLVAGTAEEALKMVEYADIYKDDMKKFVAAFNSLPNKKRIIERTKAVKKEMMAYYWHPDRAEKWAFDDDDV